MSKNVYGDEWDVKAGRADWFLRHGHGRRRRSLPIFPGYGYLSAERRPRTLDSALQEVSLEAIDLAVGIGEPVEVWHRGEDGEERYMGVASETGFDSYSYDLQASPKGAPDKGFVARH